MKQKHAELKEIQNRKAGMIETFNGGGKSFGREKGE